MFREVVGSIIYLLMVKPLDKIPIGDSITIYGDRIVFANLTADPSNPENGAVWYRSDLGKFRYYDGSSVNNL